MGGDDPELFSYAIFLCAAFFEHRSLNHFRIACIQALAVVVVVVVFSRMIYPSSAVKSSHGNELA